jgi:hypothetical protein
MFQSPFNKRYFNTPPPLKKRLIKFITAVGNNGNNKCAHIFIYIHNEPLHVYINKFNINLFVGIIITAYIPRMRGSEIIQNLS